MAMSNAERQRRWRDERNDRAGAFDKKPKEFAETILREFGADRAHQVVRALDKRLRNIRTDCPACGGSGFAWHYLNHPCGSPMRDFITGEHLRATLPCTCSKDEMTNAEVHAISANTMPSSA